MLGLPAFDKWDSYRTDRMIANMATEGKYGIDDLKKAAILNDQITSGMSIQQAQQDPTYPIYLEAVKRTNQEGMGSPLGGLLGFFALNTKTYPIGEQKQRTLQSEFSAAYAQRDQANETILAFARAHPNMTREEVVAQLTKTNPTVVKQAAALTDFFNAHPEYETRLGLFDTPEQRLTKMLTDQIWAQYHTMPTLTRTELKDQLGASFADSIANKDFSKIPADQIQVWLKLMGGKPVGTLTADQNNLVALFSGQLKLTKPELAWRAQSFYDIRDAQFPNYFQQQNAYYDPKSKLYKKAVPELKQYWDWRRQFMTNNPDLVQYLTDDPKAIAKAQTQNRTKLAIPTLSELPISDSMKTLLDNYANGQELPYSAQENIRLMAERYGLSEAQVYGMLGLSPP
jgi:hypothetical protein